MRWYNKFRRVVRVFWCLDIELKLMSFETLGLCLRKITLLSITRFLDIGCLRPFKSLLRLLRRRLGQLGWSIDTCLLVCDVQLRSINVLGRCIWNKASWTFGRFHIAKLDLVSLVIEFHLIDDFLLLIHFLPHLLNLFVVFRVVAEWMSKNGRRS